MRFVSSFGEVWRVSEKKYRSLFCQLAQGKSVDMREYGRLVCRIDRDITRFDQGDAADVLRELHNAEPATTRGPRP